VFIHNQQSDHSCISEFCCRSLDDRNFLSVLILRLCQNVYILTLDYAALNGTKVQAKAGKYKDMIHGRMFFADKELEHEINALLPRPDILEAHQDKRYVNSKFGSELLEELRHM